MIYFAFYLKIKVEYLHDKCYLIGYYDMEERKKSMPMQMNLFELYGEQKTVRWKGKETEEEPQDT